MTDQPTSPPPAESSPMRPVVAPVAESLSVEAEARAFWRMRYRLVATILRQAARRARLRIVVVLVLSLVLWLGLFWLFADGFRILKTGIRDPNTHDQTVRAVFGMFFAALLVMLVFSSGIILYSSLFRSREIALLLTIPARVERIFLHKFQEAIALSSWGFLLLGSPMLLAYGLVAGAPWYYFALLPAFLLAFVYIPAGIGAMVCMQVMRRMPGSRLYLLILGVCVFVAVAFWIGWSVLAGPQRTLFTPGWFQDVLGRLKYSEGRLLPSWWLSSGLLEASRGVWSESVLFLVVLIANALFCRQLAVWTAARVYRRAYSALYGRHTERKRVRAALVDRMLLRLTGLLPSQVRLMMVKDLRLFRRDPLQWSQFLIFFGLLGMYFLNIRCFSYDVQYVGWMNLVSFLNLSVVGLLMATFTTRFVFPMISLEGRRFWILGLLPLRRKTILWSKFLFAGGCSILPCAALIALSDVMLRVPPLVLASHQLTCAILCVGLSGIAVGLGARFPNLREQSPSRIAAGFGGTLNLVLSTLYILAVVLLTAVPCHFYLAASYGHAAGVLSKQATLHRWLDFWLLAGTAGSILLGVLATLIPLRLGFRAFRRLEF